MEELLYIVQRATCNSNEEMVQLHKKATYIMKQLHFARRQKQKLAAEALLMMNGVHNTQNITQKRQ
jgi:hypothetical protein